MQGKFSKLAAAVSFAALLTAFSAPASADDPTEVFVSSAIKNVGATSVRCSKEIRAAVRSRQMVAVCASFEGDFEMFRSRWAERMELAPPTDLENERNRMPQPRTQWEHRNGIHERIYAVGPNAVGVRFSAGELMLVYAE
jgi:hypothetical protein